MKKIIFTLVVALLAAPAWAGVSITAVCDSNVVTIEYNNSESNDVRAFALDISCSNDVNIAILDVNNSDYYIFPGSIDINENGDVDDYGTPACYKSDYTPGTAAYDGTLLGPPDSNTTIEMGSLYDGNDPVHKTPPPKSGWLIKFSVNGDTCVTLAENAIRSGVQVGDPNGAVVMEDPDQTVDVTLTGCCVTLDTCNQPCALDVTGWQPGTPDRCLGPEDVAWLIDIINDYPPYFYVCDPDPIYDACLDVTGWQPGTPDGCLGPEDVAWLIDIINDYPPYFYVCDPDPTYVNCVP
jgi:hypothetical protein